MEAVYLQEGQQNEYAGYPVVDNLEDGRLIALVDPRAGVDRRTLEQGLRWLSHWELIIPFRPYGELAMDFIGGAKNLGIGDLRVPVFDPRLIFIRVNDDTRKVWQLYQEYRMKYDYRIAILLALWEVKPHFKPLPAGEFINE